MRVPRFLKFLMAIFLVVALFRAVNNAGPLSVTDMLVELQGFRYDFSAFEDLIDLFDTSLKSSSSGVISGGVGEDPGIIDYIKSIFDYIKNIPKLFEDFTAKIIQFVTALWSLVRQTFLLLGKMIKLLLDVIGF